MVGWSGGAWGSVGQGRGLGESPLPFPSFQDNGLPAEGDKGLDGGPVESQPLAAAWRKGASPRMAPPPHSLQGLWSPLLCTFVEGRPEGCAWLVTRAPLLTQGLSHSRTSSFLPPSPPVSISLSLFLQTQSAPTLSTSMCLLRCVQPRCQPVEPRMGLWWERARCGLTECRWARWLSLEGKENLKISQ